MREARSSTINTLAERALFTKLRKAAYEALHAETRQGKSQAQGMNRAKAGNVGANLAPTFTADTAAKTSKSERAVQRDATRGTRVNESVLNEIRGTNLNTGKTLDMLAAVPVEQQVSKLEEIKGAIGRRPAGAAPNESRVVEGSVVSTPVHHGDLLFGWSA